MHAAAYFLVNNFPGIFCWKIHASNEGTYEYISSSSLNKILSMSRIHKMCVQLISIQKRKIVMLSRRQCRVIIPRHHYRRALVAGTVGPDGFPDEAPAFLKSNDVICMQNKIMCDYCSGCRCNGVMLCAH